jgi:hypothetical protein
VPPCKQFDRIPRLRSLNASMMLPYVSRAGESGCLPARRFRLPSALPLGRLAWRAVSFPAPSSSERCSSWSSANVRSDFFGSLALGRTNRTVPAGCG